jgi:hypothetical protein
MLFKFVLIGLLFLSYNIIIDLYTSNMICDVQSSKNDVIRYYNQRQSNESFILKGDIEEGLGECDVDVDVDVDVNLYDSRFQMPNIYRKNYLIFELISNMSYKIIKNMKQMVCKHVNYFYPSSLKKKSGICI